MLNPLSSPIVSVSELPLKLARKCLSVYGAASYDEDSKNHSLQNTYEEDVAAITAGKDFGLIRTSSGKVKSCSTLIINCIYCFIFHYETSKMNTDLHIIELKVIHHNNSSKSKN